MLVASIDLELPGQAIMAEMEKAAARLDACWAQANRTLTEVFLVNPAELETLKGKGDDKSLWLHGRELFRLRTESFPEKVLVFADWLFTARMDHRHADAGWAEYVYPVDV